MVFDEFVEQFNVLTCAFPVSAFVKVTFSLSKLVEIVRCNQFAGVHTLLHTHKLANCSRDKDLLRATHHQVDLPASFVFLDIICYLTLIVSFFLICFSFNSETGWKLLCDSQLSNVKAFSSSAADLNRIVLPSPIRLNPVDEQSFYIHSPS